MAAVRACASTITNFDQTPKADDSVARTRIIPEGLFVSTTPLSFVRFLCFFFPFPPTPLFFLSARFLSPFFPLSCFSFFPPFVFLFSLFFFPPSHRREDGDTQPFELVEVHTSKSLITTTISRGRGASVKLPNRGFHR